MVFCWMYSRPGLGCGLGLLLDLRCPRPGGMASGGASESSEDISIVFEGKFGPMVSVECGNE